MTSNNNNDSNSISTFSVNAPETPHVKSSLFLVSPQTTIKSHVSTASTASNVSAQSSDTQSRTSVKSDATSAYTAQNTNPATDIYANTKHLNFRRGNSRNRSSNSMIPSADTPTTAKKKKKLRTKPRSHTVGTGNDTAKIELSPTAFPSNSIFSGYLDIRKSRKQEWKRRYFAVNNNFLLCAATEHSPKLELVIPLEGSHVSRSIKSSDMTFDLFVRKHKFYFRAPNPNSCSQWTHSIEKACTLSIKDVYRFMYSLGESGYTKVVAAQHRTTGQYSAIKIVDKRIVDKKMLRTEIQILKKLDNPFIVDLYDIVETKKFVYIVMEKCDGGELFDQIASLDGGHYSVSDCCHIMHQIAKAVTYMHSVGIVHRDLKPENVLCVKANSIETVKIADFGISKIVKAGKIQQQIMKTMVGTLFYTAPEILQKKRKYNLAVDYWSIGVIMYILLCGYPPFYGDNDNEVTRSITKEEIEFDEDDWAHVPAAALDLVKGLLDRNPRKRKTCADILKLTWKVSSSNAFDASRRKFRQTVIFSKFSRASMSSFERDPMAVRRIAANNAAFYDDSAISPSPNMLMNHARSISGVHDSFPMFPARQGSRNSAAVGSLSPRKLSAMSPRLGPTLVTKFSSQMSSTMTMNACDDMLQMRNHQRRTSKRISRKISAFRQNQSKTTDELLTLTLPMMASQQVLANIPLLETEETEDNNNNSNRTEIESGWY